MPIIAPNDGLPKLLTLIVKEAISGMVAWEVRLFKNNYTPTQLTTWADLTESTFGGYSRETLDRAEWQNPTVNVDNKAVTIYGYTPIVWTVTSGLETVYGYAVCDSVDDTVYWVERFATPIPTAPDGQVALLPRITLGTDTLA